MESQGARLFSQDRANARRRLCGRLDGARDQEHLAIVGRRSCRDRGIFEIAAAGGWPATAAEGGGEGRGQVVRRACRGPKPMPSTGKTGQPAFPSTLTGHAADMPKSTL